MSLLDSNDKVETELEKTFEDVVGDKSEDSNSGLIEKLGL